MASVNRLIEPRLIDRNYLPRFLSFFVVTADLDGDGNEDLVALGADYPLGGSTTYAPQPGRMYLGDGNGNFTPAPIDRFPVDGLNTVHPRKVLFDDFNSDGRLDMFIASHGWDTDPFPGEQNRLYLSSGDGGWRDATSALPQLSDYSHTAAVGDISGRGITDILVGNGYGGQNGILSYALLNTGQAAFSLTRSIIPVARGEIRDFNTLHHFTGMTLADLNGDGLPDLVVTADSGTATDRNTRTTILWNRLGTFSENSKTALVPPAVFPNRHIDLDAQTIDINGDGLPDLVLVGTQGGQAYYDGWFVQLLINRGDGSFVDETTTRLQPADAVGGAETVSTRTPWPMWVKTVDYNGDGFPDFSVAFQPGVVGFKPDQPLIWLNDGAGHFSTFKVHDFVSSGTEWALGTAHLVRTRSGFSFITPQSYPGSGGLVLTGLLAIKPNRESTSSRIKTSGTHRAAARH